MKCMIRVTHTIITRTEQREHTIKIIVNRIFSFLIFFLILIEGNSLFNSPLFA